MARDARKVGEQVTLEPGGCRFVQADMEEDILDHS
jgi:hypothetical protein